jgi:S-ribosylhomocysteine lyase
MDLIPSFSVDHTRIIPGIFVSRIDTLGNERITTYDVRVTRPNIVPGVDVSAMHSLEHLIATYLRNDPDWKDEVIYWGPMGCLTGNYLLVKGDLTSQDILPLMQETFAFISTFEGEIPGQSAKDCGNYLLMNLPEAKWEAKKYLKEVLENISEKNLFYPN